MTKKDTAKVMAQWRKWIKSVEVGQRNEPSKDEAFRSKILGRTVK